MLILNLLTKLKKLLRKNYQGKIEFFTFVTDCKSF
jgi:hypothetical protein